MGVYRALHHMGALAKLDAISSVSGGTWASAVYMFGKDYQGVAIDTTTMLGPKTTPSELTMSKLSEPAAPMARGVTQGNSTELAKQLFWQHRNSELWNRLVAELVLKPFGLEELDSYMAASEAAVQRIKAENPSLKDKKIVTPRADRPKLFVMNGALLAPKRYNTNGDSIVSFQMCPDYTGSPFYPGGCKEVFMPEVTYHAAPICCVDPFWRPNISQVVGGGMIESFAFGKDSFRKSTQHSKNEAVGAPAQGFSLAEAVGISSYNPAPLLASTRLAAAIFSIQKQYWPVISGKTQQTCPARDFQFGDGGNLENSGLLPLLQRRAKNVIWVANSYRPLSSSYDFESATPGSFDPEAAGVVESVSSVFGYGFNDVFEKNQLLGLVRQLAELKAAGKPAVIKETLHVLPNTYWGITGGYAMNLVLIYLEEVRDFQDQLPQDIQMELAKGSAGAFANYPIY
ncbi:unnamed protein product, partial [Symbiodinium pilosum]